MDTSSCDYCSPLLQEPCSVTAQTISSNSQIPFLPTSYWFSSLTQPEDAGPDASLYLCGLQKQIIKWAFLLEPSQCSSGVDFPLLPEWDSGSNFCSLLTLYSCWQHFVRGRVWCMNIAFHLWEWSVWNGKIKQVWEDERGRGLNERIILTGTNRTRPSCPVLICLLNGNPFILNYIIWSRMLVWGSGCSTDIHPVLHVVAMLLSVHLSDV